jgi:hypothetical protein
LAHFRKSNKCFVCATPTGGVFKPAREIIDKKNKEAKELEEEAAAPPDASIVQ